MRPSCMFSSIMRGSKGGGGWAGAPTLKNHKNIQILSNTGTDPLKNLKAAKLAFNVGPLSPYNWRIDGGQMMTHL